MPLLIKPHHKGAVKFPRFFAGLRAVGYDGRLTVEDFSLGMDEPAALRDAFAFLNELAALTDPKKASSVAS